MAESGVKRVICWWWKVVLCVHYRLRCFRHAVVMPESMGCVIGYSRSVVLEEGVV